ncbi:hypothetical protein BAE36_18410 [Rhizobium leguminosarum bv. trifolii]|nr:hypothetical protein BAE36_18410 [Rhizobium leguminosarum bv. trifolii]
MSTAVEPERHTAITITPLAALLPTLGTPPPPVTAIIAPVGPAPIALIAPATVVTVAITSPATVVAVAITSPAITNLNDIALRRHRRPLGRHGGSRCDGRESRTDGNGCGEKEMCELHGCFLIADEAKISGRG